MSSSSTPDQLRALRDFLAPGKVMILTGAGCSTDSGIPDYRSPGRRPRRPIQHDEFMSDAGLRRRYWARSYLGWPQMANARPNGTHRALARFETRGSVTGIVTQNVDGLHQAAGSRHVVELHGTMSRVHCIRCDRTEARTQLQQRLADENPQWRPSIASRAPDGDVDLDPRDVEHFRVVHCLECGGDLKPCVVFFGASVSNSVRDAARGLLERSERLLVLGTSLAVLSSYRYLRMAIERGMQTAIVNRGPARGRERIQLAIDASLGDLLPHC